MREIPYPELQLREIRYPVLQMREIQNPELQLREIRAPGLQLSEIPNPELQLREIPDPVFQIREIQDSEKPNQDSLFTVTSIYANLLQQNNVHLGRMFNPQRIGLAHQHGHRFIVFVHQYAYGEYDVMFKRSNDLQGCTIQLL